MHFHLATGWISPKGKYYSCWPWDHDRVILDILFMDGHKKPSVALAEKLGYIRVTGKPKELFLNAEKPTQAQIDTMFDYKIKFKYA